MIRIETVDLSTYGVELPSDHVGMVMAQPYLSLTAEEPFQCVADKRLQQLEIVRATLQIARDASHGAGKTHFTIFPEYSIPGLDGVREVETILGQDDWPRGTIVIGGIEALTKAQYRALLEGAGMHVDRLHNACDKLRDNQWVNCVITWVKSAGGEVTSWVQPKLFAASEELSVSHEQMFCGQSIYVFKGRLTNQVFFRFSTLVCFDWIATNGTALNPCQSILSNVHQSATEGQLPITWVFVIQNNPKPSHHTFLTRVQEFFDQTKYQNAPRTGACVIFTNTAGRALPGRADQFGCSSIVNSPQSLFQSKCSLPTFTNGGPKFRDGSTLLSGGYKDTVFRERGACIHSFSLVNPGSLSAGPAGRSYAVRNPFVFPIAGTPEPRTPSCEVPASVKWINDQLDEIPKLSREFPDVPLANEADRAFGSTITAYRALSSKSVVHAIDLANAVTDATSKDRVDSADQWGQPEIEALRHAVRTLEIFGIGTTAPAIADKGSATLTLEDKSVDIVAIRGISHESCLAHYRDKFVPTPRRQAILASRDSENTRWARKFGSFLNPATSQLGEETRITDPDQSILHIGFQNLLEVFRTAHDITALQGGIHAEFAA